MAARKKMKTANAKEIKKACPHHYKAPKGKARKLNVQKGRK